MRLLRSARRNRVSMQLADGTTLEGVLMGRTDGHYILWAPKLASDPDSTIALSGHVEVPQRNVLFYQVIG